MSRSTPDFPPGADDSFRASSPGLPASAGSPRPPPETLSSTSLSSAMVSMLMALITMRIWGFFRYRVCKISSNLPPLPPIKAWVGTGNSSSPSGASASMICILSMWKLLSVLPKQFHRLRFSLNGIDMHRFRTIRRFPPPRIRCRCRCHRPRRPSVRCSLQMLTSRTSSLVIGVLRSFPSVPEASRRKQVSALPWVRRSGCWMRIADQAGIQTLPS